MTCSCLTPRETACYGCGGDTRSRSHAAADWGVRLAARASSSPFWRVAFARQQVLDSLSHCATDQTSALLLDIADSALNWLSRGAQVSLPDTGVGIGLCGETDGPACRGLLSLAS